MSTCTFDFHALGEDQQQMAINYFVKVIMDGIDAYKAGLDASNGLPFVDIHNKLDIKGGIWVAPGKGSNSYNTNNGVATMRATAGVRNGAVMTLCLFITPNNACAGEFLFGTEFYLAQTKIFQINFINFQNFQIFRFKETLKSFLFMLC